MLVLLALTAAGLSASWSAVQLLTDVSERNKQLEEYNDAIRDFGEAASIDPTGFQVEEKLKDAQRRKKQAGKKDYYKILGVPNGK